MRDQLRIRLNRTVSSSLNLHQRDILRECCDEAFELYGAGSRDICVMPISTTDWSSELRRIGGKPVVVLDMEQINAMSYLVYREICVDRPIFQYCEYMIRISELLAELNEVDAALSVVQLNHNRLSQYARDCGSYPGLSRPMFFGGIEALQIFLARVLPSFILGHEIGHVGESQREIFKDAFAAIENCWEANQIKEPVWGEGPSSYRFMVPSIRQKFDDYGMPSGCLIAGIERSRVMAKEIALCLSECKADFFGLILSTRLAAKYNLPPEQMFSMLLETLRAIDRFSVIRRVVPQIPRGECRGSVDFGASRIACRIFILVRVIKGIIEKTIPVPPETLQYWTSNPEVVDSMLSEKGNKYIEHITLANDATSRGGVYLGSGAPFPVNLPTERDAQEGDDLTKKLMMPLYWPFHMPENTYKIASQSHWNGDGLPAGVIGFASAIRDATGVIMQATPIGVECGVNYKRKHTRGANLLHLLHGVRRCVEARNLLAMPRL